MGIFPVAQVQLTPQSVVGSVGNSNSFKIQDFIIVIIICKNNEYPIKMWPQHLRSNSRVAEQNSNSSKVLCMSVLLARMKMQSKLKVLEWPHFCHYKLMGIFSNARGQLTPQSVIGSGRILNLSEISCMSSLPASTKTIR